MQNVSSQSDFPSISPVIAALIAAEGCATHPHLLSLAAPAHTRGTRLLHNHTDAVHYLCLLHGRFPGVVDHATTRCADNAARTWLIQATEAFTHERAYLTQISVALGPVPSTTGQNACDTAVMQQRHALDMLAQSDRRGCALGAAVTLVLDWVAIRNFLDISAERVSLSAPACTLPSVQDTLDMIDAIVTDEATSRAVQFGARQLLSQQRGLWDLLQSRAQIREAE